MTEINREDILATLITLDDKDKSFMLGYAVGACKATHEREAKADDTGRTKKK